MLKIHNDDTTHDSMKGKQRGILKRKNIYALIKASNSFATDYTDIRTSIKNSLVTD